MDKLKNLISEYLEDQKLMQLATVGADGQPWQCSVWQASDENYNIYFFSADIRRHSREIENDSRVAGALALPFTPEDDKPRGLQFEGDAVKLTDPDDIAAARNVYQDRIFDADKIEALMSHPEKQHFFYKITPTKFVLFDVENYPENSRQEWVLNS